MTILDPVNSLLRLVGFREKLRLETCFSFELMFVSTNVFRARYRGETQLSAQSLLFRKSFYEGVDRRLILWMLAGKTRSLPYVLAQKKEGEREKASKRKKEKKAKVFVTPTEAEWKKRNTFLASAVSLLEWRWAGMSPKQVSQEP